MSTATVGSAPDFTRPSVNEAARRRGSNAPTGQRQLAGYVPRLVGAAFLVVVGTSLTAGILHETAIGSGSISDIMVNVSNNVTLLRLSVLSEMFTSIGIVALAALLYAALTAQNRIIALPAVGCWLGEAIMFEATGHPLELQVIPSALLAMLALVNPTLRAIREQQYQREAPWVVDQSKFASAFGAEVTPHRDAIARTIEWFAEHAGPRVQRAAGRRRGA